MSELKPCPFCGGEAMIKMNCWGVYKVGCDCETCIGWIYNHTEYKDRQQAVQVWNTRRVK